MRTSGQTLNREDEHSISKTNTTDRTDKTILVVKGPSVKRGATPQVLEMVKAAGLDVADQKIGLNLSKEQVSMLLRSHEERDYYPWLEEQWSMTIDVFLLTGKDAVCRLKELVGPTKPEDARVTAPDSIRSRLTPEWESFELSRTKQRAVDNVVHCPDPKDGDEVVAGEVVFFFPDAFSDPL